MVSKFLLILTAWFQPEPANLTPMLACEAAYVIQTTDRPVDGKCCGLCVNGVITHGDGHKTPCPCPPDCECRAKGAVHHPPAKLHDCPGGKCQLKPSK